MQVGWRREAMELVSAKMTAATTNDATPYSRVLWCWFEMIDTNCSVYAIL